MKAQFGVKWALLILIVTMILLIAVIRPFESVVEEAIRTSAFLHATGIAGIINLLQASPSETTYNYVMPDMDCTIIIGEDVNVTIIAEDGKKNSYVVDIIKSGIGIEDSIDHQLPVEKDCKRDRAILFIRNEVSIEIS